MLFQLLDQVVARIDALAPQKEAPALLGELKKANPWWKDMINGAKQRGLTEEMAAFVELGIAAGLLHEVKQIPKMVQAMVTVIRDKRTSPGLRCSLVGALAMLVKPNDLIPDDSPGGYGYFDDLILLRCAIRRYMNVLPPSAVNVKNAEQEEQRVNHLCNVALPPSALPAMQTAIAGMEFALALMDQLPPEVLDTTTQMLIDNPMLAELQGTPSGGRGGTRLRQSSPRSILDGGVFLDDGNVTVHFPGGGHAVMTSGGDIVIND